MCSQGGQLGTTENKSNELQGEGLELRDHQITSPAKVQVVCFPRELVSFVRPRELVSFDPWHVTRSPPIGKRI